MRVLDVYQGALALSAFEFFSEPALQKVIEHSGLQRPFETPTDYYALLEIEDQHAGGNGQGAGAFRALC